MTSENSGRTEYVGGTPTVAQNGRNYDSRPDRDSTLKHGYPLEEILSKLKRARPTKNGYMVCCPAHNDREPSLSLKVENGRIVTWKCFAGCSHEEVRYALGLEGDYTETAGDERIRSRRENADDTTRYVYRDQQGVGLYDKVRLGPGAKSRFVREPGGAESSLYGLERLESARGRWLFLSESEKDAEAVMALADQRVAVASGGASSWKETWSDAIEEAAPTVVVILEHNDEAGRSFTARVAESLKRRGLSVKVAAFDGGDGYDVADWLRDGGTLNELLDRVKRAKEWRGEKRETPSGAVVSSNVEGLPAFLDRMKGSPRLGWFVEGLVPDEGICLWHGQPRDFKSMCAQEVALALAGGQVPFESNRFAVKRPARIAYFSEEDPERLFAERMRWLTARRPLVPSLLFPLIRRGLSFDSKEGRERILDSICSCEAEVVFFDPLRSFTAHSDKGPADFAPVARFLRQIQDESSAKTLLLVHHDTKPPAKNHRDGDRSRSQQASGGGIFSVSDCPVAFRKLGWNQVAVFPEDYKLTGDLDPFEVVFDTDAWEDGNGAPRFGTWVRPVATTKTEQEMGGDEAKNCVLSFLTERRESALEERLAWVSTDEVTKGVKLKSAKVSPILRELLAVGRVLLATGREATALKRSPNAKLWTSASSPLPDSSGGTEDLASESLPPLVGGRDGRRRRVSTTAPHEEETGLLQNGETAT